MDDSSDSFGFISTDAPFPLPITLGGTGATTSEVAAMNIIGPLPTVSELDEYDKVLIQQNSTAAIRKRRVDAFAQDMWNLLYKDSEPIEDSTAPITSGAVASAIAGNIDETLSVQGKAADAKATGDAIGELKSAIDYMSIDNMVNSANFRNTAYQTSIIPNTENRTLAVNNYVSSSNTETFYITRRENASLLTFDTSKTYFVAVRISFKDAQTAGLIGSGINLEMTNNSVRNGVSHGRFYPSMLIGKTIYVYGRLSPTISSGYLRLVFNGMGTASVNYAFDLDMVFCAELPDGITVEALGQTWKKAANPIDNLSFSGEISNLNYGNITAELICWGDSLTAGAGGVGVTYPAVCASELDGLTVLNCGVGGENCQTIAARQGGNNIVIPAGAVNGIYATLTDIFGNEISPLLQGSGANSGNALIIEGQECALTYASGTGYTISGYTGDALTVPTIARFIGSDFAGEIVTIWIGSNGGDFPGYTAGIDMRIAWINSMIKHIGHERYVILGLTIGEETSSFYINEENRMKQAFGNKYFPTRKYLIENGLTIAGVTPTTQDETDIAEGKVPTSLKSDGVHLNSYGYFALGKMLANKIRSLGYV
jgi:lysophospholipase L1-like esterase